MRRTVTSATSAMAHIEAALLPVQESAVRRDEDPGGSSSSADRSVRANRRWSVVDRDCVAPHFSPAAFGI